MSHYLPVIAGSDECCVSTSRSAAIPNEGRRYELTLIFDLDIYWVSELKNTSKLELLNVYFTQDKSTLPGAERLLNRTEWPLGFRPTE